MLRESVLRLETLCSDHDLDTFRSGCSSVDDYLRERALPDQGLRRARTFVALGCEGMVAYFTITVGSVEVAPSAGDVIERRRRRVIPAIVITRLGVDLTEEDRDLDQAMLREALHRSIDAAGVVGAKVVVASATDQETRSFYRRHGFEPLPASSFHVWGRVARGPV